VAFNSGGLIPGLAALLLDSPGFDLRDGRRIDLKPAALVVADFLFDAQHSQQPQTGRGECVHATREPDFVIDEGLLKSKAAREPLATRTRKSPTEMVSTTSTSAFNNV